jgi:transposase
MGGTAQPVETLLEGLDLAHLRREDIQPIFAQGPEAVVFLILTLSARLGDLQAASPITPSTPSSQIPSFKKTNSASKRKKSPGRKPGHEGARREKPLRIDRVETHSLERCPHCGGPVAPPSETRSRVIEDIPVVQPEAVEHIIPRCYCSNCRKLVEPNIPDAMPQAQLGHRVVALSAWLHYGLGNTLSQITEVLNSHLQMKISPGGLVQAWHRLADVFLPWYNQIGDLALEGSVLHADETGHRVEGQTHWLWCFTNGHVTYYQIDRSRGQEALQRFFYDSFQGTLVTDFWAAYNRVAAGKRQMCLVHLLRELETVDQKNHSPAWIEFRSHLKRLIRDAIRLSKREDCAPEEFASKRKHLHLRLDQLARETSRDPDVIRLVKRLTTHKGHGPQGTPTASSIANLVTANWIEPRLRALCAKEGFNLTIYVDDISVSGPYRLTFFRHNFLNILRSAGFEYREDKIRVQVKGGQQIVTGHTVNRRMAPSRQWRDRLRAQVHRLRVEALDIPPIEQPEEVRRIRGRINHLRQFMPEKAEALKRRLLPSSQ